MLIKKASPQTLKISQKLKKKKKKKGQTRLPHLFIYYFTADTLQDLPGQNLLFWSWSCL